MEKYPSDEELLKEAKWAEEHISDNAVPELASDALERLLESIERECKK